MVNIGLRNIHARHSATNVLGFEGMIMLSVINLRKLKEEGFLDKGIGMGFG